MQKYKLINNNTKEEHLCDKIIIDGFDYYISESVNIGDIGLIKTEEGYAIGEISFDYKCHLWFLTTFDNIHQYSFLSKEYIKRVIATTNSNIDISQIIEELEELTLLEFKHWSFGESGPWHTYKIFKQGYNKSQETHPFSEGDMIEFYEWCDTSADANLFWRRNRIELDMSGKHNEIIKQKRKELLQLWKEQKPKIVYYR